MYGLSQTCNLVNLIKDDDDGYDRHIFFYYYIIIYLFSLENYPVFNKQKIVI